MEETPRGSGPPPNDDADDEREDERDDAAPETELQASAEQGFTAPETAAEEPVADTVDVRFRVTGRARAYDTGGIAISPNDLVIVESERGPELGEATGVPRPRWESEASVKLPRILRRADTRDLHRAEHNRAQEREARRIFLERTRSLELDAKLVRVDYRFDGGKAVFYFMSDDRVDFRGLVRDLSQRLHTRVEMRQIGARDETRLVGGLGPCGRELCCSSWLREFDAVSIKMAKAQDLSLNPSKLAGMCGRLKCCLRYEYETYLALRRDLPKIGRRVESIKGTGEVIRQIVLKQRVVIQLDEDGTLAECSLEDLVERRPDAQG